MTNVFSAPISKQIWEMKYQMKDAQGVPIDLSVQDSWRRIAKSLASVEKDPQAWEGKFYAALEDFKYLPAGRITAGAGTGRSVTLFNCLASETVILTAEYGLVAIGEVAGETVTLLDGNGDWVKAPIVAHGQQAVASVALKGGYNGRQKQVVYATAGHRWVLEDGSVVTTEDLKAGNVLRRVVRTNDLSKADPEAYARGVQHGIIYGDGSVEPAGVFRIRLCGEKQELSSHFEGWSRTSPPSFDGDVLYRGSSDVDLKALPSDDASPAYVQGFLRGWFATDGAVCARDHRPILTCGADEADWLRQNGAVSGMEVSFTSKLGDETNYGARKKTVLNVSFHRSTMTADDFLRPHHRAAFGETPSYPWSVEAVGEYGEPEAVFCPTVSTTASFQLANGIHTGNCFVMGTIPDSMGGIFDMLKEAALTMQQGGGIGYDFSTIRPRGAEVKGVASDASGPLSFMDVWDAMCRTIMSAGSRRGAMMATMRCDHPDVEQFIVAKQDSARLRMFNLSVLITDDFMTAVRANESWDLKFEGKVYKTVNALDLWNSIMQATYDFAEPGVIFIDRINKDNNLNYVEQIAATNPCGEQPLPPYGACLLGSINLARLVNNPFTNTAELDQGALDDLVRTAVRMMDNVVDASRFPLPEQQAEAKAKRRIGLGVTGLADALLMLGLRYGADDAVEQTRKWMKAIARSAYLASVDLAKEKGAFPLFDAKKFLASGFMSKMDKDVRDAIAKHGIRNALLTSIAPTGTISLYAGNVSSGIEPVFAYAYTRKVLQKDGSKTEEEVVDYAVQMWRDVKGDEELPDYFVNAQTLPPNDHVKMQAAAQEWVDSSISKTINCPEDISFEDFKSVYMSAWDLGCKGCTTYRPNDVTGSVLSVTPEKKKEEEVAAEIAEAAAPSPLAFAAEPMERPSEIHGATYKAKWPGTDQALYITINDVVEADGQRRPFEIFVNTKNPEHFAWTIALTRMISAIFRRGGDVTFVVEELKAVFDPRGGGWVRGKYVPSVIALIGNIIEQHMISIGFSGANIKLAKTAAADAVEAVPALGSQDPANAPKGRACSRCGAMAVQKINGCDTCMECGDSKCG